MSLGVSMGGNLLANALGVDGMNSIVTASCIIEAPIKLREVTENLSHSLDGIYDR